MKSESNKVVIAATASNVCVAVLKIAAAVITGSTAMMSEGVHSLVDTCDSALLLVGVHLSKRPPDKAHPLGYGRELYFWSMVVAMIVFGAGGCINIFEGIRRTLNPQPASNLIWSYGVLGGAAVFDVISLVIGYRQYRRKSRGMSFYQALRRSKDPTTFAVILEDGSDLIGITVAFLAISAGAYFKIPWAEGVGSILIGLILAFVAFLLARECHGLLIGESADRELQQEISRAALVSKGIDQVGEPLTMYFGPHDLMVALPVHFRDDLDARSLARTIDEMEASIRKAAPDVKRIFIEPESALGNRRSA